jgi:hypothetical protein
MFRFSIRDVLWLTVVVAVVLAIFTGIYRYRSQPLQHAAAAAEPNP